MKRRLNRAVEDRPNIAAMNDGGEGGAGMAENQEMAWRYDERNDLGRLRQRKQFLERRLAVAEAELSRPSRSDRLGEAAGPGFV